MNYTKKINRNFSMIFVIFKNYILIIQYMIFIILYIIHYNIVFLFSLINL